MKKIWNLMLVALVMLGAAACTEKDANVDANEKAGFSFYAEVADATRATIEKDGEKWITKWESGDKLYVTAGETSYEFACTDVTTGKFTCYDDGVESLVSQTVTITTDGKHHSLQGKEALYTSATVESFGPDAKIKLEALTSFFRYTYYGEGEVKLTTEDSVFIGENGESTNTVTIEGFGEHFVAFWPGVETTTTLSLAINGESVKEKELSFVAGMVYNLGTFEGVKNELFGIVGGHQSWNTANRDAMYLIPNSNTYVTRNVRLASDGFKFYGETSKTVIVEHPAVTTGEAGDFYLVPNANWKKEGARFAARLWYDSPFKEAWVDMKDENGDGVYVGNYPSGFSAGNGCKVIFCRMNPKATANNWNNKWNQTADLTTSTSFNCFTIPSGNWDNATSTWSVHTPEVKDAWTEEVEEITPYWLGMSSGSDITNWAESWSNNPGPDNIKVSDTNKTYDIYFHKGDDEDWGFVYNFVVLESGSAQPALK